MGERSRKKCFAEGSAAQASRQEQFHGLLQGDSMVRRNFGFPAL